MYCNLQKKVRKFWIFNTIYLLGKETEGRAGVALEGRAGVALTYFARESFATATPNFWLLVVKALRKSR